MVRRYAAGAAAGTALVVSLTGCLGDSGKKTSAHAKPAATPKFSAAAAALQKASAKTSAIKTFRTAISVTVSAAGQDMRMSGTALYRLSPNVAMKMDMSQMTMGGRKTQGFQEVLIGDVMYLKLPTATSRPWVKASLKQLSGGEDVQGLTSQSNTDPASAIKMFTASKDVRKVGTETVSGISTTHYEGTFSMSDAMAKLDPKQRDDARQALGQMGMDKMVFGLWVDGKQLPRKLTMSTPSASKLPMTMDMVFTGYNTPVSIAAPPASQVRTSGFPGVPG